MKRNGFSLLELIIVIAILGILAAILLPALTETRGGSWPQPNPLLEQSQANCFRELRL